MARTLRDTMVSAKMCANCGLVDENGGVDFAGSGLYWYCERHLDERADAARLPSQRITEGYAPL